MNSRIVLFSLLGVIVDLLCLAGAAGVLLTHNTWLMGIGYARFWFVVLVVAIGVVPMMYARERLTLTRRLEAEPKARPSRLPRWAGVEHSVREPIAA